MFDILCTMCYVKLCVLYTLDTLMLASKKFHTFVIFRPNSYFYLATLVSLHYSIYKNRVKLATFQISYLY